MQDQQVPGSPSPPHLLLKQEHGVDWSWHHPEAQDRVCTSAVPDTRFILVCAVCWRRFNKILRGKLTASAVSPEVKQRLCFQLWAWATSCAGHLGSVSNFFYIHNKEGEPPELLSCNSFPFLFRQCSSSQLLWAWNCFQVQSKPWLLMQRWRSILHDGTPVGGLGLIILNDWRGSKSFCPTFQVT